jgi:DedD protein
MPDVAAAPLPARSLEPAPLGEPPKPERKPAAAATGRYSVQVGAFDDGKQAQGLAKNLGRRHLPVQVLPGGGAEGAKWRVRVGPVATREEADRIAAKLREEKLPTWIIAEGR